ncbi:MAG: HesB-like protein [Bacillota bacterium]|jgi:iron-sulfur cluster insertion protein|nr:HesB-like protein [Bacillota bacterium]NLL60038.1 HesB-like protein [Tissierellia bacterium]
MIFIDDTAYKEFKELLDNANVDSYNVRIAIDRVGCSGPIFGVFIDEADENDEVEVIKDITFISEKSIIKEYGGFIFVSSEENNGMGLGMKPVVSPSSGCGSCSGCH